MKPSSSNKRYHSSDNHRTSFQLSKSKSGASLPDFSRESRFMINKDSTHSLKKSVKFKNAANQHSNKLLDAGNQYSKERL